MKPNKPLKLDRRLRHARPNRFKQTICAILLGIVWLITSTLTVLSLWYGATFEMEFAELLYTLLSPVGGTGQSTLSQILFACIPPVALLLVLYTVAAVLLFRWNNRFCRVMRRVCAWMILLGMVGSLIFTALTFRIPQYVETRMGHTLIYDDYYIDPDDVSIVDADGKQKNLICIYLESMETTYASREVGGMQSVHNYIPNLTALAQSHLSFSNDTDLGGFHSITGTAWTMGALMSTTSGIPFSNEVFRDKQGNSQGYYGNFANRLTAIGDILEKKGYRQEFLCGSDSGFAGRDAYFKQHGGYEIFDLYTAREEGYIPKDYMVWWGYEDHILFDIAKDELLELAAGDAPFNFTMLTVDTHHVGGYFCEECGYEYPTVLENVVACTDRLVGEFIEWCKDQDFYEDSVIVILGDHPRMDRQLVGGVDFYDRTVYNCFINSEVSTENFQNRTFTAMDLFPTVLAALGYRIEGDRLGLGTNLFSALPTLAEELGYEWMEKEIAKFSTYYLLNFL